MNIKKNIIYLDNAAQTMITNNAKKDIINFLNGNFGNPSSNHKLGINSKKIINNTRTIIQKYLDVNLEEILFTSGSTESINIALFGLLNKFKKNGNHIISTTVEHAATLNILKHFEKIGFKVTYLDVNNYGMISLKKLSQSITNQTIFATITFVNNETGVILPIKSISRILNKIPLHVDATQAFCKLPIHPKYLGINLMSIGAHKIGALSGTGVLYVDNIIKIKPLFLGSHQEFNMRAGTENILGIKILGTVVNERVTNYLSNIKNIYKLNKYLKTNIMKLFNNDVIFNGKNTIPNIISLSFKNIMGDILVRKLQDCNIFVSTSSACNKNRISHVLKKMKINPQYIAGTIRISLSPEITFNDIDIFLKNVFDIIKNLK